MGILHPFRPNIKKLKKNKDIEGLVGALNHKDKNVQKQAIKALEEIGEQAVPHLIQAVKDEDTDIKKMAAEALGGVTKEGVVIIRGGLIKLTNKRTSEITGFQEWGLIDKKFYDFVAPEYRGIVLARYKKRLQDEDVPSRYEVALLSKDGKKVQVEIKPSLIKYEGRPADLVRIKEKTDL
ncbi:MAG: PAS domain S-box protein [Candidatus Hydrothermarchaeales archaeon]